MGDNSVQAVLFVLALVYLGLLIPAIFRTYKSVMHCRKRSEIQKVFVTFYISLWIILILTCALYFKSSQPNWTGISSTGAVTALYFVPSILLIIMYVLLYHQLEMLMTNSRVPTGQDFRTSKKTEKIAKWVRIGITSFIITYVVVQIIMIALTWLTLVSNKLVYIELSSSLILIIIALNLNQTFVYFKQTGRIYKNHLCYTNVRYLGLVCLYWTFAFIIKFIAYLFKTSFFNAETTRNEISYRAACILGTTDFLTIVIPVYLVVDPIFV